MNDALVGKEIPMPQLTANQLLVVAEKIADMICGNTPEGAMATRYGAQAVINEDQWKDLDTCIVERIHHISGLNMIESSTLLDSACDIPWSFERN